MPVSLLAVRPNQPHWLRGELADGRVGVGQPEAIQLQAHPDVTSVPIRNRSAGHRPWYVGGRDQVGEEPEGSLAQMPVVGWLKASWSLAAGSPKISPLCSRVWCYHKWWRLSGRIALKGTESRARMPCTRSPTLRSALR